MVLLDFKKLFALTLVVLINIERACSGDPWHIPKKVLNEYKEYRKIRIKERRIHRFVQSNANLNSTHYLWKVLNAYHKIQPKTFMRSSVICVNNTPSIDFDDLRMQYKNLLKTYDVQNKKLSKTYDNCRLYWKYSCNYV